MGRRRTVDMKRKEDSGSVFIRLLVCVTGSRCRAASSEGDQPRCCYSAAMIVHVILKLLRSEGLVLSRLRLRQARTPLSSITFSKSRAARGPSHREKKRRESALSKSRALADKRSSSEVFALCQKVKLGYVSISQLAAAETNTAPSSHTGGQRHLAAVCRHGSAQAHQPGLRQTGHGGS